MAFKSPAQRAAVMGMIKKKSRRGGNWGAAIGGAVYGAAGGALGYMAGGARGAAKGAAMGTAYGAGAGYVGGRIVRGGYERNRAAGASRTTAMLSSALVPGPAWIAGAYRTRKKAKMWKR